MTSKKARKKTKTQLQQRIQKYFHNFTSMLRPEGIYTFYVYILTNKNKTVLYTGFTNNLGRRLEEHQNPLSPKSSFTSRYNVYYLLYYEKHGWADEGIAREKEIKGWSRQKKQNLINRQNPKWGFLNELFE